MDITIRVTRHEVEAMNAYAKFTHKWPQGDPCASCPKHVVAGNHCIECHRDDIYKTDKADLDECYGDVLKDSAFITNHYVKEYISSVRDVLSSFDTLEKAESKYYADKRHQDVCFAMFIIREDETAETEEDGDE